MPAALTKLLSQPIMADATVLAGRDSVDKRDARWVSVVEWPAQEFVAVDDLVLTTALGCDAQMFEQLVRDVAERGACALCVSVNPEAQGVLSTLPLSAVRIARDLSCPLIQLPWQVPFADVIRVMMDLLDEAEYARESRALDRLHEGFSTAMRDVSGLDAVAEALAHAIQRPVLLLDAGFQLVGHSTDVPQDVDRDHGFPRLPASTDLSPSALDKLRRSWVAYHPRSVDETPELELGPGLVVSARVGDECLGYIYALDSDPDRALTRPHLRTLRCASFALGLELLRARAVADTETRLRGDFFWALATGTAIDDRDAAMQATLLRCDLQADYEVALARVIGEPTPSTDALAEAEAQLRAANWDGLITVRGSGELLVLRPTRAGSLRDAVAAAASDVAADGRQVNWGIAASPSRLRDLQTGYQDATRALTVGHALYGLGAVGDGAELGRYLLLSGLTNDRYAVSSAHALLEPLLAYDRTTSRGILETLDVFLAENGNTSSAARRLHLDRHSLRYRLRKIEGMTGCSLAASNDRFLLQLAIVLVRLSAGETVAWGRPWLVGLAKREAQPALSPAGRADMPDYRVSVG